MLVSGVEGAGLEVGVELRDAPEMDFLSRRSLAMRSIMDLGVAPGGRGGRLGGGFFWWGGKGGYLGRGLRFARLGCLCWRAS